MRITAQRQTGWETEKGRERKWIHQKTDNRVVGALLIKRQPFVRILNVQDPLGGISQASCENQRAQFLS